MDEVWQRAVEAAAIEGQSEDPSSPLKTLTLDSAVNCLHGRLAPPELLERFQSLEHLSIANVCVSSLANFPRLHCLRQLILSDNRIAGGLDFLVEAGLDSLRDLDLSNNRIQFAEDLAPLSRFRLVSLDLYECPVTRIGGHRSRVFTMIRSLKYLDKMDADENERPETDDGEEEEEDDEDEEDDPGSGEVDGDDRSRILENNVARGAGNDGILDVDEDDESDADEEETETVRVEGNGISRHNHISNGYRLAPVGEEEDEEEDDEVDDDDDGDDEDLEEDIDGEEGGEDVVEVHDVGDSDDEEDIDEEEPLRVARVMSVNGEIDGHEQGEEDENEEIDEEDEQVVDDDRDFHDDVGEAEYEEEDAGGEYVVHHNDQGDAEAEKRDLNACNGEDEDVVDDNGDDENGNGDENNGFHIHRNSPPSILQPNKRRRLESSGPIDDDIIQ